MDKDSNASTCIACGRCRDRRSLRPFAHDKLGRVSAWVCPACAGPERLVGKPHLAWATVARAERLAANGGGWSVDHVMRQALDLLEQRVMGGAK